jgi:NADPH-dependent glutamate synthase beta subunit-like oxidoreductase
MDAARAALRLGAAQATIVYRRSRAEMPALAEELQAAEEESVRFELLANPVRVIAGPDGRVSGLECQRMTLGEPDASGRRRPIPVPGSNFTVDADTVIFAIGQEADLADAALPLTDGKIAAAGRKLNTATPGVFAGGDVVLGPASLVEAIAHGHQAAEAIDAFCRGDAAAEMPNAECPAPDEQASAPVPDPSAKPAAKQAMPQLPAANRLAGFREIELGYNPPPPPPARRP